MSITLYGLLIGGTLDESDAGSGEPGAPTGSGAGKKTATGGGTNATALVFAGFGAEEAAGGGTGDASSPSRDWASGEAFTGCRGMFVPAEDLDQFCFSPLLMSTTYIWLAHSYS